jgi:hypothetical protein
VNEIEIGENDIVAAEEIGKISFWQLLSKFFSRMSLF